MLERSGAEGKEHLHALPPGVPRGAAETPGAYRLHLKVGMRKSQASRRWSQRLRDLFHKPRRT